MFMTNTPDNIYAVLLNPFFTGVADDELAAVAGEQSQPPPLAADNLLFSKDTTPSPVKNVILDEGARGGTEVKEVEPTFLFLSKEVEPTFFFLSEIVVDATHDAAKLVKNPVVEMYKTLKGEANVNDMY
jgi:hypothetical protein